jgi:hypothetical protein
VKTQSRNKKAEAEARLAAKIAREEEKKGTPARRPISIISCEEGVCQELIHRRKIATIILFVYKQHNYERQCGIPLENYSVGELNRHLELLMAGKYAWITAGK